MWEYVCGWVGLGWERLDVWVDLGRERGIGLSRTGYIECNGTELSTGGRRRERVRIVLGTSVSNEWV